MAVGAPNANRSMQDTPTWALATVCFIFIFAGISIEHLIHLLSHWLKKHRKTALFEAVEKLKSVLMVLGFVSLILTVTQRSIVKICIPNKAANRMLPCRQSMGINKTTNALSVHERILAATPSSSDSDYCASKGKTSLISGSGVNQLSIFICALAIMQIVYSVLTMALGRAKMRSWKAWERETQTVEYQAANDPNRFRYTRQTTFGRRHTSSTTAIQIWTKCFFRQFFNSVAKVDYLTLRHGFIEAHLPNNTRFNFQSYIQRSLDDDFKQVVGISPFMWFCVFVFLLLDIHGVNFFLWVSFLPLLIVLVLGTKLQVIVAEMALQMQHHNTVIKGSPLVQPNNNLFWFGHPRFVLTLLHYTLFMNAFELAFFVWVTQQFGINSCYHERAEVIVIRLVLAVAVQIMCSYITLPLYALVTQMGSQFKSAILEGQTANVIKEWHTEARKKMKKQQQQDFPQSNHSYLSPINTTMSSPDHCSNTPNDSLTHISHHRNPTLGEITCSHGQNEIVEDAQEICQHMVPSTVVEMSELHANSIRTSI